MKSVKKSYPLTQERLDNLSKLSWNLIKKFDTEKNIETSPSL